MRRLPDVVGSDTPNRTPSSAADAGSVAPRRLAALEGVGTTFGARGQGNCALENFSDISEGVIQLGPRNCVGTAAFEVFVLPVNAKSRLDELAPEASSFENVTTMRSYGSISSRARSF